MRRQLIDDFSTRPSEGHAPHIPRGFSHPRGHKLSTTTVLDLRTGQDPYLPRGISSSIRRQIIDYSGTRSLDGTSSLSPKKEFFLVHETAIDRVLRYSILERDKFPISKDLVIQEMIIHRLLRTRLSEDSKLLIPRRNPSSSRRQLIDYDSTRPKRDELSIKGIIAREDLPISTALDKEDSSVH
jgi:hypothetical protein